MMKLASVKICNWNCSAQCVSQSRKWNSSSSARGSDSDTNTQPAVRVMSHSSYVRCDSIHFRFYSKRHQGRSAWLCESIHAPTWVCVCVLIFISCSSVWSAPIATLIHIYSRQKARERARKSVGTSRQRRPFRSLRSRLTDFKVTAERTRRHSFNSLSPRPGRPADRRLHNTTTKGLDGPVFVSGILQTRWEESDNIVGSWCCESAAAGTCWCLTDNGHGSIPLGHPRWLILSRPTDRCSKTITAHQPLAPVAATSRAQTENENLIQMVMSEGKFQRVRQNSIVAGKTWCEKLSMICRQKLQCRYNAKGAFYVLITGKFLSLSAPSRKCVHWNMLCCIALYIFWPYVIINKF